jgi:DNA-binding NtrC family response regulator
VRELRNAVARTLALGELSVGDLGEPSEEDMPTSESDTAGSPRNDFIEDVLVLGLPLIRARARVVEHFERRFIARLLSEHDGNVARAAHASGIARRHFHRLMAKTRT